MNFRTPPHADHLNRGPGAPNYLHGQPIRWPAGASFVAAPAQHVRATDACGRGNRCGPERLRGRRIERRRRSGIGRVRCAQPVVGVIDGVGHRALLDGRLEDAVLLHQAGLGGGG
ncbi:MAG: hypothetical protein ACK537_07475, partial [Pseudomonadota bacterium]